LGETILNLYKSRKVSQFVNAERTIDALRSQDIKAIPKADIFINKNENKESRQEQLKVEEPVKSLSHQKTFHQTK